MKQRDVLLTSLIAIMKNRRKRTSANVSVTCHDQSIHQTELPQGNDIAITGLDIIFNYITQINILNLFLFFLLASYLKSVFTVNQKIRDWRGGNVLIHSQLVEKESLAHGADFCIQISQNMYERWVVQINFVHLAQSLNSSSAAA